MKTNEDQLHCPKCGAIIPQGQSDCPNPKCPSKKKLLLD